MNFRRRQGMDCMRKPKIAKKEDHARMLYLYDVLVTQTRGSINYRGELCMKTFSDRRDCITGSEG